MPQDDNMIKLQAKLDQTSSKQNINTNIKTLQKLINPIKLQVKVDSKAESGIKSLLMTAEQAMNSLESMISTIEFFNKFQNIGKRRISVRISDTVTCFEYALHA